jgi:2-keto-3-deoxy-L-rhamnonate aldolase RhmA
MLLVGSPNPDALQLAVRAGMSTIVLDCEHGFPFGSAITHALIAAEAAGGKCIVRLAPDQRFMLGAVADSGIHGVVLSGVTDMSQIDDACEQLLPPPTGRRSINPFTPSAPHMGDVDAFRARAVDLQVWAMAETAQFVHALGNTERAQLSPAARQIWHGVIIGPYDLAAALGEECEPDNPNLTSRMIGISNDAARLSLRCGLFARNPTVLGAWLRKGVQADSIIAGYDRDIWASSCSGRVEEIRSAFVSAAPGREQR